MKSSKTYKDLIIQLHELQKKAGLNVWERIHLAIQVFEDREFREDLGLHVDDFKAAKTLDSHFRDLCYDFLDLKAMYEYCNDKERWGTGNLQRLHAEMVEAGKAAQSSEKRSRRAVSLAELRKESDEKQHFKARNEFLETEIEAAQKLIKQLQEENNRLTKELEQTKNALARAEGKLEVLIKSEAA